MAEKTESTTLTLKMNKGTITAIVLAVLGFAWNKWESHEAHLTAQTQQQVQGTTYDLTAREIEDIWAAIEAIQEQLDAEVEVTHTNDALERILRRLDDIERSEDPQPALAPPEVLFERPAPTPAARAVPRKLPDFDSVQKAISGTPMPTE